MAGAATGDKDERLNRAAALAAMAPTAPERLRGYFLRVLARRVTWAGLRPYELSEDRFAWLVPRLTRTYRGVAFTEMDVDAVLARRPEVALVDELAHTNVPGGRNEKRWQDVQELLDAGIEVITTVNIQHLESLNDVVEKIPLPISGC